MLGRESIDMKTIIFSGFGNFESGYRANTTELLAQRLNGTTCEGYRIIGNVFPCTLSRQGEDRASALLSLARREGACGIIATGMSSTEQGFGIETTGRNEYRNKKYCPPEALGTHMHELFSCGYVFDVPLTQWRLRCFREACKEAGIAARFSYDAGGFCCEELIVRMYAAEFPPSLHSLPFIFMHVPCSPETVLDEETHRKSGKTTLPLEVLESGIGLLPRPADL